MEHEISQEVVNAFMEAQKSFKPVKRTKTATIGSRTYNYADLADVLEAVIPALNTNGFILLQPMRIINGQLRLCTELWHKTGGKIVSDGILIPENLEPKLMGAVMTYARRYDASTLLGISTEEDNDAAGTEQKSEKSKPKVEADKPTSDELKKHHEFLKSLNQDQLVGDYIKRTYKVKSGKELTKTQWDEVIKTLREVQENNAWSTLSETGG